jgi:hypothetical protein
MTVTWRPRGVRTMKPYAWFRKARMLCLGPIRIHY